MSSLLLAPASIFSFLGTPFKAAANIGLSTVSGWIIIGAVAMLQEVIRLVSLVTTPSLTASWFSPSYWQIAGLAMLLTVPFLFAAAVQAIIQTNLGVLFRAAFIDLPIATLAVTITAPLVTLLLAATDEMCTLIMGANSIGGGGLLSRVAVTLPDIGDGLMPVTIAVVILIAGLILLVELLMRAAAIYIVVLFLPLGFAAMVWPARRIWVKRMIEMLIALILSKFAMIAILSLATAGLTSIGPSGASLSTALTAMALMVLAALSPWALLRLLPFTELAAGISGAGHLSHGIDDEIDRGFKYQQRAERSRVPANGPVAAEDGNDGPADLLRRSSAQSSETGDGGSAILAGIDRGGAGRRHDDTVQDSSAPAGGPTGREPGIAETTGGHQPGSGSPEAGITETTGGGSQPGSGTPGPNSARIGAQAPGDTADPTSGAAPGRQDAGPVGHSDDAIAADPATRAPLDRAEHGSTAPIKGPVEDLSPIFRHGDGLPDINLDPRLPGGLGAFEQAEPPDRDTDAEEER